MSVGTQQNPEPRDRPGPEPVPGTEARDRRARDLAPARGLVPRLGIGASVPRLGIGQAEPRDVLLLLLYLSVTDQLHEETHNVRYRLVALDTHMLIC